MSLTGVWMNELNSIMVLTEQKDGSLIGKYRSIVGRDSHVRDLSGRFGASENGKQMLGFAVCFEIDEPGQGYGHSSLCAWSGWARERIETKWLLALSLVKKQDEWSSFLIGEDTFEKVSDTPEEGHLTSSVDTLSELLRKARSTR